MADVIMAFLFGFVGGALAAIWTLNKIIHM